MKIGILTFHRAINYGAVLQCYALYKTLSNLGHQVEVIDYRPSYNEKYRMFFRRKDFCDTKGIFGKLRYVLSNLSLIQSKIRTNKKFDYFIKQYLQVSSIVHKESDIPRYYDAVFFGSDQIWNPAICEGLDKLYWGQFHKGQMTFVGYALSVGRLELFTPQLLPTIVKYLDNYDYISVRENNLQHFIQQECNREATLVCDPSLLLNKKEYEKLTVPPKESKYVLLFCLEKNPYAKKFANNIAKQIAGSVVQFGANVNPFRRCLDYTRSCLSPVEFLSYIRYADCIVTDSFHATSFSIIMHRNFYTLKKQNNNARLETILETVGLADRLVLANTLVHYSPVSWLGVDNKIENYKRSSLEYIKTCLIPINKD